MTELSHIESAIASLEDHFAVREGVRVPFHFGRNALLAHENQAKTAVFWIPQRGSVSRAVDPLASEEDAYSPTPERPKIQKTCRFLLVCKGESTAAVEALHDALLSALAASPVEVSLGDWEWETEQEHVAAPSLRGSTIAQEVSIPVLVPENPPNGARWGTVRRTDHECFIDADPSDSSDGEQHHHLTT